MSRETNIRVWMRSFDADMGVINGALTPFRVRYEVDVQGGEARIMAASSSRIGEDRQFTAVVSVASGGRLIVTDLAKDSWSYMGAKATRDSISIRSEGFPSARLRVTQNDGLFVFTLNNRYMISERQDGTLEQERRLGRGQTARGILRDLFSVARPLNPEASASARRIRQA